TRCGTKKENIEVYCGTTFWRRKSNNNDKQKLANCFVMEEIPPSSISEKNKQKVLKVVVDTVERIPRRRTSRKMTAWEKRFGETKQQQQRQKRKQTTRLFLEIIPRGIKGFCGKGDLEFEKKQQQRKHYLIVLEEHREEQEKSLSEGLTKKNSSLHTKGNTNARNKLVTRKKRRNSFGL
nr:hypothetical protein [Tanacetum cinerariifolium]